MPDPIQDLKAAIPPRPTVPSGQKIYDSIMSEIEPDLAMSVVKTLDQKYQGESDNKKKIRMKRYQDAFVEYNKRYAAYMEKLNSEVGEYKRTALAYLEAKTDTKEEVELKNLESSILSA